MFCRPRKVSLCAVSQLLRGRQQQGQGVSGTIDAAGAIRTGLRTGDYGSDAAAVVSTPIPCWVLLPNTKQLLQGASDGPRKEDNRSTDRSARRHAGAIAASRIRDQLDSLLDETARRA